MLLGVPSQFYIGGPGVFGCVEHRQVQTELVDDGLLTNHRLVQAVVIDGHAAKVVPIAAFSGKR